MTLASCQQACIINNSNYCICMPPTSEKLRGIFMWACSCLLIMTVTFGQLSTQVGFVLDLIVINLLYTGRLFLCYMLVKSICHFRGVKSLLTFLFYF